MRICSRTSSRCSGGAGAASSASIRRVKRVLAAHVRAGLRIACRICNGGLVHAHSISSIVSEKKSPRTYCSKAADVHAGACGSRERIGEKGRERERESTLRKAVLRSACRVGSSDRQQRWPACRCARFNPPPFESPVTPVFRPAARASRQAPCVAAAGAARRSVCARRSLPNLARCG